MPASQKPKLTKICSYCGKEFKTKSRTRKGSSGTFCETKCRVAAKRKRDFLKEIRCIGYLNNPCPNKSKTTAKEKRCPICKPKESRFRAFPNTVIGRQVINTVKRAGSVETFPDVEAIRDFAQLCTARAQFNSIEWGKHQREFSVCHKVPVQHPEVMGLTTGENLFIGISRLNSKAGNRDWGDHARNDSLYAQRNVLKKEYFVKDTTTEPEIMEMLLCKLGPNFLDYLVDAKHPKKDRNKELSDDLCKSGSSPAKVLASEVRRIYGASDPDLASTLIDWANYVEGYHSDSERQCWVREGATGTVFNSDRWEHIQHVFQTGIEFDCDPFYIGYEPIDPDAGWTYSE